MGVISQIRGTDSAGLYQIKSNVHQRNQADFEEIYKTNGTFIELLDDLSLMKNSRLLDTVMVDVIMGHVRAATRGAITEQNAHPFICRNLVGMHNGTLKDDKYKHATKTDSELMFQDMAWNGIPEVLSSLDKQSAYTVVIYDKHEKCLFFAKNDKRPLHFALLKERNVLYWASEKLILQLALKRKGIEADYFGIKDNVVYRLRTARVDRLKQDKMFSIVEDMNPPPEPPKKEEKALVLVQQGPATPVDQVVKDVAKELENKKKEEREPANPTSATILPLIKPREKSPLKEKQPLYAKGDTRQFHLFCDCGKDSLNLFEAYMCKQGAAGYPQYNKATDTFICQGC